MSRAEDTPWDKPALAGTPITRDRYSSTAFMEQEWEKLWTKVWLLVARAPEIPEPGDYSVEEIGPESFITVRQKDGSIRSFYNVCQHRGSRITFAHEGTAERFVCPYHGWEWATNGILENVGDPEDFRGGNPCG